AKFKDLVQRVRSDCLGAYAHQDMPFERLVAELQPERDLSRSPLFQVLFSFQHPPREASWPEGLKASGVRAENPASKYDLTIEVWEQKSRLAVTAEYALDIFDQETMDRLLQHYRTVLEGVIASPDAPLWQLPVLLAAEERRILVEWNATEAEF